MAKARLGREAAYGFCQHLEGCGAGTSGAVSACVSTDLPLEVLVLTSKRENLSPVCNTEQCEAELRPLQPPPTRGTSLVSWGTFSAGLCKRVSGLSLSRIRAEQEEEIDGLNSKTALQYFKSQLSSCQGLLWPHIDLIGLSSAKHLF